MKTENQEVLELTDCPDKDCFICKPIGYPSSIKMNEYHKHVGRKSLVVLLQWIDSARVN